MVKRYAPYLYCQHRDVCIEADFDGDYVLYTDYVELEGRCERLQSLLNKSTANANRALDVIAKWEALSE